MNAKTPTVSGRCHFYSYFQNPSESSGNAWRQTSPSLIDNRLTVNVSGISLENMSAARDTEKRKLKYSISGVTHI